MSYTTTKKDFEKYKKETKHWIDKFGLHEYEWFVEHDQCSDDRAICGVQREDRIVKSVLQQKWDDPPTTGEVERTAFHEFVEIFLSPLWILAERRFVTQEEFDAARHSIIRRMENCIWKPDFDRRSKKKG